MSSPIPIRDRALRLREGRPRLYVVPPPKPPTLPTGLTGRQQDVWLEVAAGHRTAAEISVHLGIRVTTVDGTLAELRDAGHVRLIDWAHGCYEVTG